MYLYFPDTPRINNNSKYCILKIWIGSIWKCKYPLYFIIIGLMVSVVYINLLKIILLQYHQISYVPLLYVFLTFIFYFLLLLVFWLEAPWSWWKSLHDVRMSKAQTRSWNLTLQVTTALIMTASIGSFWRITSSTLRCRTSCQPSQGHSCLTTPWTSPGAEIWVTTLH